MNWNSNLIKRLVNAKRCAVNLCVRLIYHIFYTVHAQTKIVFLNNFAIDKYQNLSLLFNYIYKKDKNVVFINTKAKNVIEGMYQLWIISQARIIVVDCSHWIISKIKIRERSKLIYIGHGGGVYKKMGYSRDDFVCRNESDEKNLMLYGQYDYVLATTEHFDNEICNNYRINKTQILHFGMPRTDFIISKLNKCGKETQCKSILFAPSYVESKKHGRFIGYDLDELNKIFLRLGIKVYVSIHPDMRNKVLLPNNWIDVSGWEIFNKILEVDVLISDYSSIMFDFCCTGKPIILIDNVVNNNLIWPRAKKITGVNRCGSIDEMENLLCNYWKLIKSDELYALQMNCCRGEATIRVGEFILKK